MPRVDTNLEMEGAEIIYPNFTGKEGMYNAAGDRNFCLLLPEDVATAMAKDGWNIKRQKTAEDPERGPRTGPPYIQVTVGYGKGRPPYIELIANGRVTEITENEVEMLDWIDIASVDVIVRPYNWAVNGDTGVKAYLKELYVTQDISVFRQKYSHLPRLGQSERLEIAAEAFEDDVMELDPDDVEEVYAKQIES